MSGEPPATAGALVARMRAGDRRALARLMTLVESHAATVAEIMAAVHRDTGRGYAVGVTGPPGAGKSTLVDRLIERLRKRGATVGVVAVDPTSPFTGGAVLGDRIRMQAHTLDPGVFIRSMATRGSLGGVARATGEVLRLLDAAGFGWLLVETVGVGQTELDVMRLVDTTVVVLVPESGDGIQAMKAGLLEAADVLVVNKADREGAHRLVTELRAMVHLRRTSPAVTVGDGDWEVPVLTTEATGGVGIDELLAAIEGHRARLETTGALARRRETRRARELRDLLLADLHRDLDHALRPDGPHAALVADVEAGRIDPHTAATKLRGQALHS
ncbi:MAG TPA: methylmalonyl Co-A mutase-associated GTPase MeaB [Methylomirabilota bacterium]|nr:methylmalonyl Co-A mutase-associated GTPase MeaB [Methylomirabilota bacterium]